MSPSSALEKVLIAGAGTGFGSEIAVRSAEKGFDVVATAEIYGQVEPLKRRADQRGVTLAAAVTSTRSVSAGDRS